MTIKAKASLFGAIALLFGGGIAFWRACPREAPPAAADAVIDLHHAQTELELPEVKQQAAIEVVKKAEHLNRRVQESIPAQKSGAKHESDPSDLAALADAINGALGIH